MLEAAEVWKKKAPNVQKIIDYSLEKINYVPLVGIYKGENDDSIAIGIASFVWAQYAKYFKDAFEVNNKDVVHPKKKVQFRSKELVNLLGTWYHREPRIHYLYPKDLREMGAHCNSSNNNYKDKVEQKFSMLFDIDNCSFFSKFGCWFKLRDKLHQSKLTTVLSPAVLIKPEAQRLRPRGKGSASASGCCSLGKGSGSPSGSCSGDGSWITTTCRVH